jgi:hypothetical protein
MSEVGKYVTEIRINHNINPGSAVYVCVTSAIALLIV